MNNETYNKIQTLSSMLVSNIKQSLELPKRDDFDFYFETIQRFNISLIGLRQVGKTTLAEQLIGSYTKEIEKILYLNMKFIKGVSFDTITSYIFEKNPIIAFIDEVQEIEDWTSKCQGLIDLMKNKNTRFVFSGSNVIELKKETMLGRVVSYNVNPLSFNEYKNIYKNNDLIQYLYLGSYPKDKKYTSVLEQYIATVDSQVIDKVIIDDLNQSVSRDKFKTLMSKISNYIGNETRIANLSNDKTPSKDELTSKTTIVYLNDLLNTNLVKQIFRFNDTNTKRPSKLYFTDKSMIYRFNDYDSLNASKEGALIENIVFNYLDNKYQKKIIDFAKINYFVSEDKREIDFIVPEHKLLIEVKYYENLDSIHLTKELNSIINDQFIDYKKIVVSKNFDGEVNGWTIMSLVNFLESF